MSGLVALVPDLAPTSEAHDLLSIPQKRLEGVHNVNHRGIYCSASIFDPSELHRKAWNVDAAACGG